MPTNDTPTPVGALTVILNQRSATAPYHREVVEIQGDEVPGKAIGFDGNGALGAIAVGASAATVVTPVNTIADLRARAVTDLATGAQINVAGYYTGDDGGGGPFWYDATSVASDNAGTVIAPASGSGRWLRMVSGPINVRWFGAKGDDITNDTAAFDAAAVAAGRGGTVFIPEGLWRIGDWTPPYSIHLRGAGEWTLRGEWRGTILRAAAGAAWIIRWASTSVTLYNMSMEDLMFEGNSNASGGVLLDPTTFGIQGAHFHRVSFFRCTTGVKIGGGVSGGMQNDKVGFLHCSWNECRDHGIWNESWNGQSMSLVGGVISGSAIAIRMSGGCLCWVGGQVGSCPTGILVDTLSVYHITLIDYYDELSIDGSVSIHAIHPVSMGITLINSLLQGRQNSIILDAGGVVKATNCTFNSNIDAGPNSGFIDERCYYGHPPGPPSEWVPRTGSGAWRVCSFPQIDSAQYLTVTITGGENGDQVLYKFDPNGGGGGTAANLRPSLLLGDAILKETANDQLTIDTEALVVGSPQIAAFSQTGVHVNKALTRITGGTNDGIAIVNALTPASSLYLWDNMAGQSAAAVVTGQTPLILGVVGVPRLTLALAGVASILKNTSDTVFTNCPRIIDFFSDDAFAAGMGAGIGLGGRFVAGTTSTQFAYIAGVKENATSANADGMLILGTRGAGLDMRRLVISSTGAVSIGATAANASALLDLTSTTRGLLPPRMTKAQRNAIATPADGLVVYQTDNTPGLRVREGGAWVKYTATADA